MKKILSQNEFPFSVLCEGSGTESVQCSISQKNQNAYHVSFRNAGPEPFCGVLRIVRELDPAHFSDPFLMIPGFFYNGRDPKQNGPIYDPDCKEPHQMISQDWNFAADRSAMPLIYAWESGQICSFAADPHYECSADCKSDDPEPQCGTGFSRKELRINIPAEETPFSYSGLEDISPVLRNITIPPDGSVSITVYCQDITGSQDSYRRIVRDFARLLGEKYPPAEMPDPEKVLDAAAEGIHAHYHPDHYFIYSRPYFPVIEQISNMRFSQSSEWHQMNTGFVNGFPLCLALLQAGKYTDEAENAADKMCREGISPSGLFYADYLPKEIKSENGTVPNPLYGPARKAEWGGGWLKNQDWLHSRTISDAALSLAKMLKFKPEKTLWRNALRKNLERVLQMQLPNGSFGQYYHSGNGTVVKEEGCGGLLWIPALLMTKELFPEDPEFYAKAASAAEKAGNYYKQYVLEDNIWGAPEDNDSPTSEDGMNAVIAYAALYRTFKTKNWLEIWQHATDWMLTFRKAYNVIVPEKSLLGIYKMRSRGGDFASASNNHLHVFEVLCIPELKELAEVTGDDWYSRTADENFAFAAQYLAMEQGQFCGFKGAMAEQFYWNSWNSLGKTWKKAKFYEQKGSGTLFTAVWCNMVIASGAAYYLNR